MGFEMREENRVVHGNKSCNMVKHDEDVEVTRV